MRTAVGIDQFDERIVLNGTDSSSTNAGDNILFETATGDTGTGILNLNQQKVLVVKVKRALIHSREIKIDNNPMSRVKDNLLLHLATNPFRDSCGIVLESGSGNLTDNLVLDGIKPFDDIVFFEYEAQ